MLNRLAKWARVGLPALLCGLLLAIPGWAEDRSLFWSVSGADGSGGWLLGTIHSEDPRVLDFTPEFLALLSGGRAFAMELVPDLPTLAELARRMQLPEGESLSALTGAERFEALSGALERYGVPAAQADRLRPWAAMMTLSVPPPQTGLFMDFSLSLRASGAGVEVLGLETLDQQMAFLEEMTLEQQLALLDHAIAESDGVRKVHDGMVEAYLSNDLQALHRQAMEQLSEVDEEVREVFLSEGIDARNRRMLEAALPQLGQGGVFIAVGALHLPGEEGLIALLREAGYQLEPAAWPLNPTP